MVYEKMCNLINAHVATAKDTDENSKEVCCTGMLTVRPVLELALVARLVASPPPGLRDLKQIIQV